MVVENDSASLNPPMKTSESIKQQGDVIWNIANS